MLIENILTILLYVPIPAFVIWLLLGIAFSKQHDANLQNNKKDRP